MPEPKSLRDQSSGELAKAAASIAGFRLTRPEYGSAANVSGLRTRTQTFSSRRDSLTIFASDNRYGYGRRAGAWTGDGRTAIAACRRVLRAAKVPAKEIARIDVVSEMGQLAERPARGKVRVHEPEVLRKLARAGRAVEGIPVWSSYATVGLNAKGEVGSLEVHWPELPSVVVKEAGVLQAVVAQGFKPPKLEGARPETVEAGIVHSPAVAFFMDAVAAVRVIYRGTDPSVGRKATLYLDRHGEPVVRPRDIVPAESPTGDRQKPPTSPPRKPRTRPRTT